MSFRPGFSPWLLGLIACLSAVSALRADAGFFQYELDDDNRFEKGQAVQGPDGRFTVTYAFDVGADDTFEFSVASQPGDSANPASLGDHLRLFVDEGGGSWEKQDTLDYSVHAREPKKLRVLFTTEKPGQSVRFRVKFRHLTMNEARPIRLCHTLNGEFSAGNDVVYRTDEPELGYIYQFTARSKETSLNLYAGHLDEKGLVSSEVWFVQTAIDDKSVISYRPKDKKPFGLRIHPLNTQIDGKLQLEVEIAMPLKLTYDPRPATE